MRVRGAGYFTKIDKKQAPGTSGHLFEILLKEP